MQQPCLHCDQPDTSLLRLVLIGEILRADESQLVLLADVMYRCGLLPLSDEAEELIRVRQRRLKERSHMVRGLHTVLLVERATAPEFLLDTRESDR
jgi:hypothetical protein